MAYTVKAVATALNLSPSSVRNYTKEFSEFMSDTAHPQKGQTRKFTDHDVAVLQTVSILRSQFRPLEEVHEFLQRGELLEPPEGTNQPNKATNEDLSDQTSLVTEREIRLMRQIAEIQHERGIVVGKLESAENSLLVERDAHKQTQIRLSGDLSNEREAHKQTQQKLLQSEAERAKSFGRLEEIERTRTLTRSTLDDNLQTTTGSADFGHNYALLAAGVLIFILIILLVFVALQAFG